MRKVFKFKPTLIKIKEFGGESMVEWSSDFSYDYFRSMIQAAGSKFEICLFSQVPDINHSKEGKQRLLLRHDIDVDPSAAVKMAEIENKLGIKATYFAMTNSQLYSIDDESSKLALQRISNLGHEIGLHFDFDSEEERKKEPDLNKVETNIVNACNKLENVVGKKVKSISFHRPLQKYLKGPLMIAGRVNAYSKELMDRYLSDSKGRWREGEPLPMLINSDKLLIQLLIHPIWWGENHMSPPDRIQAFFKDRTNGYARNEMERYDKALAINLEVIRTGLANNEVAE